jgi:hypothetical protein
MYSGIDLEATGLPRAVRHSLLEWRFDGKDVRHSLTRATFYRHRGMILKEIGLDIALEYDPEAVPRANFDLEELKSREVRSVPHDLQSHLFDPGQYPLYERHYEAELET